MCVYIASLKIAANADLSTILVCLISTKLEVNRAIDPVNLSTGAVTSLLLPHTSCISLCTIPMEC